MCDDGMDVAMKEILHLTQKKVDVLSNSMARDRMETDKLMEKMLNQEKKINKMSIELTLLLQAHIARMKTTLNKEVQTSAEDAAAQFTVDNLCKEGDLSPSDNDDVAGAENLCKEGDLSPADNDDVAEAQKLWKEEDQNSPTDNGAEKLWEKKIEEMKKIGDLQVHQLTKFVNSNSFVFKQLLTTEIQKKTFLELLTRPSRH